MVRRSFLGWCQVINMAYTVIKAYQCTDTEYYFVYVDDINCGIYTIKQLKLLINSYYPCIVKYFKYNEVQNG